MPGGGRVGRHPRRPGWCRTPAATPRPPRWRCWRCCAAEIIATEGIIIDAASGTTGAGRKASEDFSFSEVDGRLSRLPRASPPAHARDRARAGAGRPAAAQGDVHAPPAADAAGHPGDRLRPAESGKTAADAAAAIDRFVAGKPFLRAAKPDAVRLHAGGRHQPGAAGRRRRSRARRRGRVRGPRQPGEGGRRTGGPERQPDARPARRRRTWTACAERADPDPSEPVRHDDHRRRRASQFRSGSASAPSPPGSSRRGPRARTWRSSSRTRPARRPDCSPSTGCAPRRAISGRGGCPPRTSAPSSPTAATRTRSSGPRGAVDERAMAKAVAEGLGVDADGGVDGVDGRDRHAPAGRSHRGRRARAGCGAGRRRHSGGGGDPHDRPAHQGRIPARSTSAARRSSSRRSPRARG